MNENKYSFYLPGADCYLSEDSYGVGTGLRSGSVVEVSLEKVFDLCRNLVSQPSLNTYDDDLYTFVLTTCRARGYDLLIVVKNGDFLNQCYRLSYYIKIVENINEGIDDYMDEY